MKKTFNLFFTVALISMISSCTKKEPDVIKIGGIAPLSGEIAIYGVECKSGIDLAVEEINASGGIAGRQVNFICENDEGISEKTVNMFEKLTTIDNVKIIIGSLTSACTKPITSLSQAGKIVLLAPAATASDITNAGSFIFRSCFIDDMQGTVGGKFAAETLGCSKAAVLYDAGNSYSAGLTENFISSFKNNGGLVTAVELYNSGDRNFDAQLNKIKDAQPDIVYLPDYYNTVALIAKQMRSYGIDSFILGGDGWDGLTDEAGDEVLNGFYVNHYTSDSSEPDVQKFVSAFYQKYAKQPNSFAALGYDCMYLLKDAIERAGTDDPEAVKNALEKTDGNYVTGHITFDVRHNPLKSAVMLKLVKNDSGKLSAVYEATVNP